MFLTKRKFLLPIVIAVSLCVALLGIRVPGHVKPLKHKASTRAVFEVQAKESMEGLGTCDQLAAPCGKIAACAPATCYVTLFHHETRCNNSIFVTSAPARASPFHS